MSCGKNSSNTTVELQESESITTADNLKSSEDSNVNYTVIKDSNMGSIKRSVEVMLEEKITEEELQILANLIRDSDSSNYERTFIGYRVKGEDNNAYWATTHFDPNLEVKILGLSKAEEENLAKSSDSDEDEDKDILGVWLDDRAYISSKIRIYYSKENILYFENTYTDGSSGVKEMISKPMENGNLRIEDKDGNDFGEYFIINEQSQLEFWSENGNFYTAKSI